MSNPALEKIEQYFKLKEQLDARKEADIAAEKKKVHDDPVGYVKGFVQSQKNLLQVKEVQAELEATENEQQDIIKATEDSIYTVEFAAKNNVDAHNKVAAVKEAQAALQAATEGVAVTYFNEDLVNAVNQFNSDTAANAADKVEINAADTAQEPDKPAEKHPVEIGKVFPVGGNIV